MRSELSDDQVWGRAMTVATRDNWKEIEIDEADCTSSMMTASIGMSINALINLLTERFGRPRYTRKGTVIFRRK